MRPLKISYKIYSVSKFSFEKIDNDDDNQTAK